MMLELFCVLIGAVPAFLAGIALGYIVRDDQLNRQVMPKSDYPTEHVNYWDHP